MGGGGGFRVLRLLRLNEPKPPNPPQTPNLNTAENKKSRGASLVDIPCALTFG